MAQAHIPVDLFNPGQVFGCLGFVEAAQELLGDAEAAFDWRDGSAVRFVLRANGEHNPFLVALDFLASASVTALAPFGSANDTGKWGVATRQLAAGEPFPFADPDSPATLPAILEGRSELVGGPPRKLTLDHWGDGTERDTVKFWAGSGGYPSVALVKDALDLVQPRCRAVSHDPFSLSAEQSSSFRLDWRRDNIPIDLGFSLNSHPSRISAVGYPLVELFAAVGLGNARPRREEKLVYRYAVAGAALKSNNITLLPPELLRASLGGSSLPFPQRHFCMRLSWPGKEGQARAITTVTEEKTDE